MFRAHESSAKNTPGKRHRVDFSTETAFVSLWNFKPGNIYFFIRASEFFDLLPLSALSARLLICPTEAVDV